MPDDQAQSEPTTTASDARAPAAGSMPTMPQTMSGCGASHPWPA